MKETSVVIPEEIPAIGVTYAVGLPEHRTITFQTHVAQTASSKEFNAVLDKIKQVADRQFAFGQLTHDKRDLEVQQKLSEDHAQRLAVLDAKVKQEWARSNKRGDPVLSARERQEQMQAYATAEQLKKQVVKIKQQISEQEAIINGA